MKSQVKMRIMNLLKIKNLLRLLLLSTLVYYLPWVGFFLVTAKGEVPKSVRENTENGMGGGAALESYVQVELEPEFGGVPEPEEYSRPHMLTFSSYTLEKGDIIGNIAAWAGLNTDTLISVNNIKNTRLMQIGQVIRIPNQDGIYYTVKKGDTLEDIAIKYKTTASHIRTVNELFSDTLASNASLFIPGAKMDWIDRQEINGDLFIWPCAGYISSAYGYRVSPFADTRQFHSGLDIGAPVGSPVKAAMSGRVAQIGNDDTFGNYVLISHHSGYRTFYAHMSVVRVKAGAYVGTGERIGEVGTTGLSTGPHLHFTVYKNGVTVNPRSLMK
jgi:murein DD-endopeptidase MepM/ murein hydrolase activator NlpD